MNYNARQSALRVIGVDTSLRSSGVAVVQARGNIMEAVEYCVIRNPPTRPVSHCLLHLSQQLTDVIRRCEPNAAAIEGVFYCKNVKTALALGQARGAALAAIAAAGIPVCEYPPRRVKMSVTGHGTADKEQVRRMIMTLLHLRDEPQEDAADALAIAVCHLHGAMRFHSVLAPKEI